MNSNEHLVHLVVNILIIYKQSFAEIKTNDGAVYNISVRTLLLQKSEKHVHDVEFTRCKNLRVSLIFKCVNVACSQPQP